MKAVQCFVISCVLGCLPASAEDGKHLFILSGQSNMARSNPAKTFSPIVEKHFGESNVTTVIDAEGGEAIRKWYKDWETGSSRKRPDGDGELYDRLMKNVKVATEGKTFETVTFLWMQGERDANEGFGNVYEESLKGLIKQLSEDLGRDDIHVVIGRLSDYFSKQADPKDWVTIRDIQVKVADELPKGAWVDTDDLNDGIERRGKKFDNDLHYSKEGYVTFGKRMAEAAIKLIEE